MGLYLAVFASDDEDHELDGLEVGSYADFDTFRQTVVHRLEAGAWGSRFPTLMWHKDNTGVWSSTECAVLEMEMRTIADELSVLPPVDLDGWQSDVANFLGLEIRSLHDCFIDVDGEHLVERLGGLAALAARADQPIWFL